MRIAAFGDIHGNIYAPQAVLADLRDQRPDALAVSGDLVSWMQTDERVRQLLAGVDADAVVCGHTHSGTNSPTPCAIVGATRQPGGCSAMRCRPGRNSGEMQPER